MYVCLITDDSDGQRWTHNLENDPHIPSQWRWAAFWGLPPSELEEGLRATLARRKRWSSYFTTTRHGVCAPTRLSASLIWWSGMGDGWWGAGFRRSSFFWPDKGWGKVVGHPFSWPNPCFPSSYGMDNECVVCEEMENQSTNQPFPLNGMATKSWHYPLKTEERHSLYIH